MKKVLFRVGLVAIIIVLAVWYQFENNMDETLFWRVTSVIMLVGFTLYFLVMYWIMDYRETRWMEEDAIKLREAEAREKLRWTIRKHYYNAYRGHF